MKQVLTLVCIGFCFFGCNNDKKIVQYISQETGIKCDENGCVGIYEGPEFINDSDIAHQFSNKMSLAVGDKLKELYVKENYRKVNFSKIEMTTVGMGSGKVIYKLSIPFIRVKEKCDAYTSFDHVGGWNHAPAILKRKQELQRVLMDNDELNISQLKTPQKDYKNIGFNGKIRTHNLIVNN